jgi:hypothetical protein
MAGVIFLVGLSAARPLGAASLFELADRLDDERPIVGVPMTVGAYLGMVVGMPIAFVTGLACLPVHALWRTLQGGRHDTRSECYWLGADVLLQSLGAGALVLGGPVQAIDDLVGGGASRRPPPANAPRGDGDRPPPPPVQIDGDRA